MSKLLTLSFDRPSKVVGEGLKFSDCLKPFQSILMVISRNLLETYQSF